MPDDADGIQLEQHASVWMEECVIYNSFYGILVSENANLCATNCIFKGPSKYQAIGVEKSESSNRNIFISNCIFTDCGSKLEACITIPARSYGILTVNGNWFKNMEGFPIGLASGTMHDRPPPDSIFPSMSWSKVGLNQVSFRNEGLFRYLSVLRPIF